MASAAERAAQLRAQADALEQLDALVNDLTAAKAAYRDNPSRENRQALRAAMDAVRTARAAARDNDLTVGGDAYVVTEEA